MSPKFYKTFFPILILTFHFISNIIIGQSDNELEDGADVVFDSLIHRLNDSIEDTSKIKLLNEISWNYAPTNFEKSKRFADSAFVLATSIGWKNGKALSLKNLGEALRYKGDVEDALEIHKEALILYKEVKDQKGTASVLSNLGIGYYMISNFPKAFEYYTEALKIRQDLNDKEGTLKNLTLIGILFYNFKRYDEAKNYYYRALTIAKSLNSKSDIALQLMNIGIIYSEQNKFDKALDNYIEAQKIFLETKDLYNNSVITGNICHLYFDKGEYDRALKFGREALKLSEEINDSYGIAFQNGNIGKIKYQMAIAENNANSKNQLFNSSKSYLISSIELFQKLGLIEEQIDYLSTLGQLQKNTGNYIDALSTSEQIQSIKDSIYSFNISKAIAELQVDQDLRLREKEIELLNQENEYQKIIRTFLIGIAVLLIILSLYLFYHYRVKKSQNKVLEENIRTRMMAENALKENERDLKNHKNQLEYLVQQRTKELETEILERKNTEDNLLLAIERVEKANKAKSIFLANMSHELRTPLVGILGYSQLLSSEIPNNNLKDMAEGINRTGNRLLHTLSMILDLARIESDEFEINLTDINLHDELQSIYDGFKGTVSLKNIDFELKLSDELKILKTDRGIFRVIIENLVNNAIKFTKEGKITIATIRENNFLNIVIRDTGLGIKKAEIKLIFHEFKQLSEGTLKDFQGTGLGLSISKKYIEHLDGELVVESEFGVGSVFTVKFPI